MSNLAVDFYPGALEPARRPEKTTLVDQRERGRQLWAHTQDGWKLALYHKSPENIASPLGPVLLVHGLGANRYNMAAPVQHINFAQYLRDRGHDVWVAELRGAGRSRYVGKRWQRRKSYNFNDLAFQDAPALIQKVLSETGAKRVHWVGHSLGGMVAYAAMINGKPDYFQSVVTLGSPGISANQHPYLDYVFPLRGVLNLRKWSPYRPASIVGRMFPRLVKRVACPVLANHNLMHHEDVRALVSKALAPVSLRLVQQFATWYTLSKEQEGSGLQGDYWRNFDKITRPTMMVAGAADRIVPLDNVQEVFDQIKSDDKKLLVCSKANGFAGDYGHIDLILARSARFEIYPRIAEWIEQHGANS